MPSDRCHLRLCQAYASCMWHFDIVKGYRLGGASDDRDFSPFSNIRLGCELFGEYLKPFDIHGGFRGDSVLVIPFRVHT